MAARSATRVQVRAAERRHLGYQRPGVYRSDQRLEQVFAELARRRATVFAHPTSSPCWEQTALGVAARDRVHLRLPLLGDRISAFLLAGSPRSGLAHDSVARLRRLYYNLAGAPFPRPVSCPAHPRRPRQLLYGVTFRSRQRAASSCGSRSSTPPRCRSRAPPAVADLGQRRAAATSHEPTLGCQADTCSVAIRFSNQPPPPCTLTSGSGDRAGCPPAGPPASSPPCAAGPRLMPRLAAAGRADTCRRGRHPARD